MKISFVQPQFKNIWEPLWAGYIKAFCEKYYDFEAEFFHGNFDSENKIVDNCRTSDIVAISCTTPTYKKGLNIAGKIKHLNPNVKIAIGGWHVTATKDIEYYVDHIIVGEGEVGFLGLLAGFNVRLIDFGYTEFKNIPWPDRDFINQNRTLDLCERQCGKRILSFQSRRGCPMNCTFCAESCMTYNNVRVRDPNDLLDEIEYAFDKYDANYFKFVDPTWCYPKSAAKDFCLEKIKRGNKFLWEGLGHGAFIDKELMELMKESGCNQINIGCESGSQKLLNDMRKGVTVSKIKKVFKWGKELGIDMRSFFILGMPNESEKTIEQTKQLVREIEPNVFGMTLLTPFPGSDYYRDEYKDFDWSNCDEYSNDFWYTKNFSNKRLKEIQADFNKEFNEVLVSHQRK